MPAFCYHARLMGVSSIPGDMTDWVLALAIQPPSAVGVPPSTFLGDNWTLEMLRNYVREHGPPKLHALGTTTLHKWLRQLKAGPRLVS